LPPLSPRARALLVAERDRREDGDLKARALERAHAALEGERWSGILLRQTTEHSLFGIRSRFVRGTLVASAAVGIAGLAAAGVHLVTGGSAERSTRPTRVEVAPVIATTAAESLDSQSLPAIETGGTAAREPSRSPTPSPTPSISPASHAPARGRASDVKQYAIELRLLEPARSSIARRDYAGALGSIARHRREYPNGQLGEERDALRVRALWGLGQRSDAEAAAAEFRRRYPRSALLSWMKDQPKQ
jgi:hypothetical protein